MPEPNADSLKRAVTIVMGGLRKFPNWVQTFDGVESVKFRGMSDEARERICVGIARAIDEAVAERDEYWEDVVEKLRCMRDD